MIDWWRVNPKKRQVKINGRMGIIYNNVGGVKRWLFYGGNLLIIAGGVYLAYLYWPLVAAGVRYKFVAGENIEINQVELPEVKKDRKLNLTDFWIEIPKIAAKARVGANVSPFDKQAYLPVLEQNMVAHARGSGLPGAGPGETVYLFAHSTSQNWSMVRKNAIFYFLDKLEAGDTIRLGFSDQSYIYQVEQKVVVGKNNVEYLDYKVEGKEMLMLQTCWPLGTNWKRLMVVASLAAIEL